MWESSTAKHVSPINSGPMSYSSSRGVLLRSCLLEHYIMPFEGERSSIIFFNQDGVMGHFEPNDE